MEKSSREKIALAVFAVLILFSLVGLGWYIIAGHSWNIAASTIDDTVGEMEGYTAIIYPGTVSLEADEDATADVAEAAEGDSSGTVTDTLRGISLFSSHQESQTQPVDLDLLEADYQAKGAQVLALDVEDLSRYSEGSILKRGSKRIGVVSVDQSVTQLDVSRVLHSFELADVDCIVAITPDRWRLGRLGGIDIVICTGDEGIAVMGETVNGTLYVNAPQVGHAGVVLISPSNVVSAKEVTE